MANKVIMAVGAHADDIELNVGGTLSKYKDNGYEIVYVMATNNMSGGWQTKHPDGTITRRMPPFHEEIVQRKKEAGLAAEHFGTEAIHLDNPQRHYTRDDGETEELRYGSSCPGELADTNVPTIITAHEHNEPVKKLSNLIVEKNPEVILTHGIVMVDMEHCGTCLLVTKAYKSAVKHGFEGALLHWHDITVGFYGTAYRHWDTFVDISKYQQAKIEAVGIHACQMPNPDKLDYPGWGAACGCEFAEVFNVVNFGNITQNGNGTPLSCELLNNCASHIANIKPNC